MKLFDMDQTQLLFKAMELEEENKQLKLDKVKYMNSARAIVRYKQTEAGYP